MNIEFLLIFVYSPGRGDSTDEEDQQEAILAATTDIVGHIHRVNALKNLAEKMGQMPAIHHLQQWQCERLLVTHSDLAQQPAYQQAMAFFVEELYGPKDFSQRDADIARVVPKLAKVLPATAMNALNDALALNALSFELDQKMVAALNGESLNNETYALAYREVGEQDARERQIAIIRDLGHQLADVIDIRGIGMLISLSRRPAKLAGLLSLHEFLQRGYDTFKKLGDVNSFIDPVIAREEQIMLQLFKTDFDLQTDNPIPHVPTL